jgi:hypothetical protein
MPNTSRNHRNQRNNPYALDELAARLHHSPAGTLWRWRAELTTLALTIAGLNRLTTLIPFTWAALTTGATLALLAVLPWTRRRAWCLLDRHRIQRLCYEARLHTRSGRLPLVLRAHPTKVGERLHILCRAGICAEDFEAHLGELRAACYAREARVARNKRWSQLVTIDIIRRDTLAASHTIPTPLTQQARHLPAGEPSTDLAATRHP